MNKNEILNLLYVTKDYDKLKKICSKKKDRWHQTILAKTLFNQGNYKDAAKIFFNLKMFYESGYSLLLQGDIYNAKRLWKNLEDTSPLAQWGKALLGFIEKKPSFLPSYFQIRNFLEQDLDALLSNNLISYAENLINSIDTLAQINSESYKYIARVLFNHSYYDIAKNFLEQSKSIYYKDPETHFLLGKIFLIKHDITNAKNALNTAIEVNGDYFPAKKLLENIP